MKKNYKKREKRKKDKFSKIKFTKKKRNINIAININIYRYFSLFKIFIIILLSIIFQRIFFNHRKIHQNNKIDEIYYNICLNCVNQIDKVEILDSKCDECTPDILYKDLKIVSTQDTLDEIIKNKRSLSRFSDGEFFLTKGSSIRYQKYNLEVANRLKEVVSNKNENENLLIGIDFPYKKEELDLYIEFEHQYWIGFFKKHRFRLFKILNFKKKYYTSDISRFYHKYKDKSHVPKHVAKLRKIWESRDVLIVEGIKSRIGAGNDLLNNTKSIKRIICPAKNAFEVYNKIVDAVSKISKDHLVLIALGPTATLLAYDLANLGYQAVDIGHTDIQYELYLRHATGMIQIPHKFTNDYNDGRNENVGEINDPEYYKQIIEKILD